MVQKVISFVSKNTIREENFLIKSNQFVRKSAKFEINSGNKSASVRAVRRFEPYGNVSGRCTYLLVEE